MQNIHLAVHRRKGWGVCHPTYPCKYINSVQVISSTCGGRSAALKLCVVVSGVKISDEGVLKPKSPKTSIRDIPSLEVAGGRHYFDLDIY